MQILDNYFLSKQQFLSSKATSALPVHAEGIAIPTTAGSVSIVDHLPMERARVVRDLEKLRMPEHLWNRIPIACHQVASSEEDAVARKMLAAGMAELIPESQLPHDRHGRLLLGGLFCVSKNDQEDRLIYDRMKLWNDLVGLSFLLVLVLQGCCPRGSGDDLRNFYYSCFAGGLESIQQLWSSGFT